MALLLSRLLTSVSLGAGANRATEIEEQIEQHEKLRKQHLPGRKTDKAITHHHIDRKKLLKQKSKAADLDKKNSTQKQSEDKKEKVIRKVKPWNLITATKKLSVEEKDDFGENAVQRILRLKQRPEDKSGKNKKLNQVYEHQLQLMKYRAANELHTRLLARLVSQFGGNLHSNLLDFLLNDVKSIPVKLDLCLQWLYDEFQMACDQADHDIMVVYKEESNYRAVL